ncbi:type II toxin-antitoxin system HipA family toxin [Gulosibacter bifidus]|uniref:Type II toxin-antitoxin system HipA family toxin n=1 Tax=Gulosibacter bifidus TaxID=272239 RepID=A0ABW5RHD7_9MICO|nr:type II toxin-antitoxin system HipA family toxin [Gulosibacter bifidus]
MTSNVYIWTWLPHTTKPVVAGTVNPQTRQFRYGLSYLERLNAIPLGPDLPLTTRTITPTSHEADLHGTLLDALPDRWGRRVLALQLRNDEPDNTACMLHSDSNRFGAIDFQRSAHSYTPRVSTGTLDELHAAAERIDQGEPLSPALEHALQHGTSIGGARPKAQLTDATGNHWLAKFSSSSDPLPVVQAEAVALDLARQAGINTPDHKLVPSLGKHVLLVKRFDRDGEQRHHTASMLNVLSLTEMTGRYATYPKFLEYLGANENEELFRRVAFNIAIGNTDDHARNHAAFWDGKHLTLTPAYDIDPTARPRGWDANQAIAYSSNGDRESNLATLINAAHDYQLSPTAARNIVDHLRATINDGWDDATERAQLPTQDANAIKERSILREAATADLPTPISMHTTPATPPNHQNNAHFCGADTQRGSSCKRRGNCPYHGT